VDFVIYILSIWAVIGGANFIVINSELISMRFSFSKFLIGAFLIAFGSSMPEIVNSIMANLHGRSSIAISNLIGSSIFNFAVLIPIIILISKENPLDRTSIKDISWLFLVTSIFVVIILDANIGLGESIFLIFIIFIYILSTLEEKISLFEEELFIDNGFNIFKSIFLIFIGFILLIIGSYFAIESAISIANSFNLSDWRVGLLLIAISTSLPKLAIALSIVFKNRSKVAVTNIFYSTISNLTIGIGLSGIIRDISILEGNIFDILTLLLLVVVFLVLISNRVYTKSLSFIFLGLYTLFLFRHLSLCS